MPNHAPTRSSSRVKSQQDRSGGNVVFDLWTSYYEAIRFTCEAHAVMSARFILIASGDPRAAAETCRMISEKAIAFAEAQSAAEQALADGLGTLRSRRSGPICRCANACTKTAKDCCRRCTEQQDWHRSINGPAHRASCKASRFSAECRRRILRRSCPIASRSERRLWPDWRPTANCRFGQGVGNLRVVEIRGLPLAELFMRLLFAARHHKRLPILICSKHVVERDEPRLH